MVGIRPGYAFVNNFSDYCPVCLVLTAFPVARALFDVQLSSKFLNSISKAPWIKVIELQDFLRILSFFFLKKVLHIFLNTKIVLKTFFHITPSIKVH